MAWIQCIIETTQENAEQCSEFLMGAKALAVTFEDAKDNPLFEPPPNTEPLWESTRVIGLFDDLVDLNGIKKYLKKHLPEQEFSSLKFEPLEERDWVSATNQTEAISFGNNLWIIPSNHTEDVMVKDPNATCVILDAGLAFGTGTHPTTALCLQWLAANPPQNKRVLDYGCGSGILGIAALKLGAQFVYAVDHDPQALYSTKVNAEKNLIPLSTINTLLPTEIPADLKVDLILANILAEPLITLAPRFAEYLPSQGVILLSGILSKQLSLLEESYSPWFTDFKIETRDEWLRIQATRI